MILNCSFLTEDTLSPAVRKSIERDRVKVYYDLRNQRYVCHPVTRQERKKRSDSSLLAERFADIRRELNKMNKPKGNFSTARDEKYEEIRQRLFAMKQDFIDDQRRKESEKNEICEMYRNLSSKFGFTGSSGTVTLSDAAAEKKIIVNIDTLLEKRKEEEIHAEHARAKRFARKVGANLERINYFFTITMDPSKWPSEEAWLDALFKFFANCSTRKGTKIMGAIEYGDENGQIHFHGIACLTAEFFKNNELENKSHYSNKEKRWVNYKEHPHIRNRFGKNEFVRIDNVPQKEFLKIVNYVSVYATKQGNKTFYSRGLPDCSYQYVSADDLFFEFDDGIVKYYPKNDFKMHVNDVRLILQRNKGQKEDIPEEELPFALTS